MRGRIERGHDPDVRMGDQVDAIAAEAAAHHLEVVHVVEHAAGQPRLVGHRIGGAAIPQVVDQRRMPPPDGGQVVSEIGAVGNDHRGIVAAGGDGQAQAVARNEWGQCAPLDLLPPEGSGISTGPSQLNWAVPAVEPANR